MKFNHPQDTKMFLLGFFASMTAVIVWDIVKDRKQIFNFKNEGKN